MTFITEALGKHHDKAGFHCGEPSLDHYIHAIYALVVDAIDDAAANFYRHFGFIPLFASSERLFLPVSTSSNEGLVGRQ